MRSSNSDFEFGACSRKQRKKSLPKYSCCGWIDGVCLGCERGFGRKIALLTEAVPGQNKRENSEFNTNIPNTTQAKKANRNTMRRPIFNVGFFFSHSMVMEVDALKMKSPIVFGFGSLLFKLCFPVYFVRGRTRFSAAKCEQFWEQRLARTELSFFATSAWSNLAGRAAQHLNMVRLSQVVLLDPQIWKDFGAV